ncbi:hypothetical protein O181_098286 [Austropuccinia psidii MF-1]|uniref:Uncharacterized protein n=1 Tax=Austropuccinia psidii MF-1 TaxID=1389203 RepID=A0A9Q3JB33_9BASI|nr:hypothetical protein [Austropuccinia psidii MF-1]
MPTITSGGLLNNKPPQTPSFSQLITLGELKLASARRQATANKVTRPSLHRSESLDTESSDATADSSDCDSLTSSSGTQASD